MELDLRTKRAVIKLRKKGLTYEEIAEALSIGRATVNRTLRAWRERRSLKSKKRGGGNPSPLRKVEREFRALVEEFSDATAEELATVVGERLDVHVSRSSIIRFLHLLGFTLKKRSSWPKREAAPTFSGVAR